MSDARTARDPRAPRGRASLPPEPVAETRPRQFIDATDELRGVLVIAMVPPELMTDEARGLPAYTALQLRVADEVRDRRRANPFAALVRLEVRLKAVA
jgi:hypothetical protein